MLRLRIVDYFDSLRHAIDLFTETKISQNEDQENFWNERREMQIEATRQIEQAGLKREAIRRRESTDGEEMTMSQVLSDFCFSLEYNGLIFLATVNKYVDPKEIELLRRLAIMEYLDEHEKTNLISDGKSVFIPREVEFEISSITKLSEILSVESAVADMSWWFDLDYHLERAKVSYRVNYNHAPFVCPFRINTLEIQIFFHTPSDFKADSLSAFVESIKSSFDQVGSIIVFYHLYVDIDEATSKSIASIKWNDRTISVLYLNSVRHHRIYPIACQNLNQPGLLKKIHVNNLANDWFSKLNWGHIYEIVFSKCKAEHLRQVDFSSLCSLRSCHFVRTQQSWQMDWGFFDPIRDKIEHLNFECNKLNSISWRVFARMTKLKQLRFDESEVTDIEVDPQEQLFVDLVQLKSLNMKLNSSWFSKKWICDLPALEELVIDLVKINSVSAHIPYQAKLHFKVPNLSHFKCSCNNLYMVNQLVDMFTCFSHVNKLSVDFGLLKQGCFKEFECTSLVVWSIMSYQISSDLFIGLNRLTYLDIRAHENVINHDAFRSLVNLKSVILRGVKKEWIESNRNVFDGMKDLQTIQSISAFPLARMKKIESLVEFPNLNKFILVNTFATNHSQQTSKARSQGQT